MNATQEDLDWWGQHVHGADPTEDAIANVEGLMARSARPASTTRLGVARQIVGHLLDLGWTAPATAPHPPSTPTA